MKLFLSWSAAILCTLTLLSSCKKNKEEKNNIITCYFPAQTVKNVSLNVNEAYSYDLGNFNDEEGATIQQQAKHFVISETDRKNGNVVYHYQPATDYIGTDTVWMTTARGSNGASPNTDIAYVVLLFSIGNKTAH